MEARSPLEMLEAAARDGVFPGAVLLCADGGEVVLRHAAGRRAQGPAPATTVDTVYDVASLTKVLTTCVVMRLHEAGRLSLDDEAIRWVPELAAGVRVRDLLAHASGLPAWQPLYERIRPGDREAMVRMAAAAPLEAAPGTRSVYSDLGFMVLGAVCERVGGARLDALAHELVLDPLGLRRSMFVDLEAQPPAPRPSPVAPTEVCPRRGLLEGEVHDDNCHAAGGVLGHAGLFSTVDDLSLLAGALVTSWRGGGVFAAEIVRTFFRPAGVPGSTWRLGLDGPAPSGSQAGELWPKSGVGHLGFTGCSLWIDPSRARWVVLLSNRVHPSRDNNKIRQFRPLLHDAVVEMLEGMTAA